MTKTKDDLGKRISGTRLWALLDEHGEVKFHFEATEKAAMKLLEDHPGCKVRLKERRINPLV